MDAMLVLIICGIVFLLYLRCGAGGCRWLSPNPILNFVIPVNGPWLGFFRAGVKKFLEGWKLEAGGWEMLDGRRETLWLEDAKRETGDAKNGPFLRQPAGGGPVPSIDSAGLMALTAI